MDPQTDIPDAQTLETTKASGACSAPSVTYRVYYELDVADCEPELIATVPTLAEAWAVVRGQALAAWEAVPEACPHPDTYARVPTRADMKGHEHAFFDIPADVGRERPTWIAVSDRDTFFVYPGDWEDYCAERDERVIADIAAETGGCVTYIGGV